VIDSTTCWTGSRTRRRSAAAAALTLLNPSHAGPHFLRLLVRHRPHRVVPRLGRMLGELGAHPLVCRANPSHRACASAAVTASRAHPAKAYHSRRSA
jgi:hypothetical protein